MDASARVGIDFDNTIVDYGALFLEAGSGAGFVPSAAGGEKNAVRDHVRKRRGEPAWQQLQAQIYGPSLQRAVPYVGFLEFLKRARKRSVAIYIVSHKSVYAAADPGGSNLHETARDWLKAQNIRVDGTYFELSRAEKLQRICDLRCTHFIDDLPEVLDDPMFPASVARILFAPAGVTGARPYPVYSSWSELADEFVSAAV
jgi:hypothetical protein